MSAELQSRELARQIVLRHRGEGHLRFGLPAALCGETCAAALEAGLRAVPGVYRVTVYRRQGKLSVFYDANTATPRAVAQALHGALAHLDSSGGALGRHAPRPAAWAKEKLARGREKLAEWRFKARLLKEVVNYHPTIHPWAKNLLSERTLINFFNDLVVFYLIKAHWDLITQRWLRQPLKYRNAWLSTFYLVYLMVRYRRQPPAKS